MIAKLTHQQEAFCRYVADGLNQSDAYRSAYNAENMTDKSIHENASKVAAHAKVQPRLRELKEELEEQQLWSRENSVKVLAVIARDGDLLTSARVSSVKELNAMHGFNEPVKIDLSSTDGTMTPVHQMTDEQLAKIASE